MESTYARTVPRARAGSGGAPPAQLLAGGEGRWASGKCRDRATVVRGEPRALTKTREVREAGGDRRGAFRAQAADVFPSLSRRLGASFAGPSDRGRLTPFSTLLFMDDPKAYLRFCVLCV